MAHNLPSNPPTTRSREINRQTNAPRGFFAEFYAGFAAPIRGLA